jgi:transglutaminase-like putative cysteine protease
MSASMDQRRVLDAAATVGLALYSFTAALGFARVFGDWVFVGDVLIVIVVGHGLSWLLRQWPVPGAVAVAITALVVGWVILWLNYPETFSAVFPTGETFSIARADLGLVRDQFSTAVAPVAYVGGWSLLAAIGTGLAVLLGDTFAFRARARGEALVPAGVLFVFVAAVGVSRHRVGLTLALVAAGVLAAALLRARFAQPPRTVLGRPRRALGITVPAAAAVGTAVVVGAWAIGPRLPGAGADALIDTKGRGGGVTEVLNPLVDIRARLVDRSASELFVVRASAPAYWRATGLSNFDGETWDLPDGGSLEDADGTLANAAPGSTELVQRIEIRGLGGDLLPAAAEPTRVVSGEGVQWAPEASTLVHDDPALKPGDRFEVVSAIPNPSPEQLRSATSNLPPDPIYLALPEGFPNSVRNDAVEVTAGAPSTYDAMVALQNWFRSNFEYSLEVPQGHGTSAIEAFLRQRIGYCEQFAGTFAAMARSLGVPARVAVGFTPGLGEGGEFTVLGKNAHAWPEVWFDELGWVPFEPTPGRGAPNAENYTGVEPDQDDTIPPPAAPGDGDGGGGEDGGAGRPEVPVTVAPTIPRSEVPPEQNPDASPDAPVSAASSVSDKGPPWTILLTISGLIGAVAALPAVVRWWRRRHRSSDTAREMIELWRRALGAVSATGFHSDPSLTPMEQARAAAPRLPVAARPLRSLAAVATAAAYAPPGEVESLLRADADGEPGPQRWCRQVERVAADYMTAGGRFRRYFTIWR